TTPNPSVTVVLGVANAGTAVASGCWFDRLYLSSNATLSGTISSWGFYNCPNAPTNGSYQLTNSVTLPLSQSGTYYLLFKTDDDNRLYEGNESNNVSVAVPVTFNLTPPDLVPVSLSAPANVTSTTPNPTVQVTWGVTNQGTGSASGWYDRVWFSTNGLLDGQSQNLGDFYSG